MASACSLQGCLGNTGERRCSSCRGSTSPRRMAVTHHFWLWVLPELRRFPAQEQGHALRKASQTELDIFELLGVGLGLVLVTAATQYVLPDRAGSTRLAAGLFNFILALPLMAVVVAPFHVRRLRRGLRKQLRLRDQHE